MPQDAAELTQLMRAAKQGDEGARNRLAREVYAELRKIAGRHVRRERGQVSVRATALASDAFVRLFSRESAPVEWEGRTHFYAVASAVMRRVLVDGARSRGAAKRGGGDAPAPFDEGTMLSVERDEDVLRVEEAIERLGAVDPRHAEIVTMRFHGGLGMQEIAEALGTSKRAVEREWTLIKAWLRRELSS